MPSAFRRSQSQVYIAAFRAWDAAAGKWIWRQQSTGVTDYAAALAIAHTLEQGASAAQAGVLTRQKALAMVNDILRLAGLEEVAPSPTLASVAAGLLSASSAGESTRRKYRAQWASLETWAGDKAELPVSAWTTRMIESYYEQCTERFSGTTANDHLRFVGMLFSRAVKLGHISNNPADAVQKHGNDSITKETITRTMQAALLRSMRRAKAAEWSTLASLGWHTGHRLQDLLDATGADGDLLTLNPRKKGGKGREVVLPIPRWLAKRLNRLGGFKSLEDADNRNGRISGQFIAWLKTAGIDPLPVERGARVIHRRSFHSYRHSMQSRLTAAGVSGELARLVTDHESPQVARRYVHAEIESLRTVLARLRGGKQTRKLNS